ncbi:MAG: discoidin domain-containing protein [Archangium sp.]|nr:discoidin domain-containing protein [Archangium sp.]
MTETATTVEWTLRDPASLARGRALLRYADAVLFTVDEPPDGGRLAATTLLLGAAVEELTAATDPGFQTPCADHAFWAAVRAELSLDLSHWGALFSRAERSALTRAAVLELRRTAWAGVRRLEVPEVAAQRASAIRWFKVLSVVTVVIAVVALAVSLSREGPVEPGLLAGKPFRVSSKLGRDSGNPRLLFHTESQLAPWVEYDLQQPTVVQEVSVENRSDCCDERVLPLVVEASDDQATWRELARRTEPFSRAVISFAPVRTRYLRLRVDRTSFLHLEAVGAR